MDARDDRAADWKDTQGQLPGAAARALRRRRVRSRGPGWTTHPLTLLLAVVVSVALLWAAGAAIVHWRERVVAARLQQIEQEAARQARLRAEQVQREAAQREEQRQAKLEEQEAVKAQVIAERQRMDDDARLAEAAAAERKEKAWARFYRRPAECETEATMECVNGRIRARRNFEVKWNQGEF
jgi:hypothetical protein